MKLIDVDTLMQEIKSLKIILNAKPILNDDAKDTILRIIDEQPIVDLAEHDKQIIEHIVNQCIFIVRRNSSNGYRDIDGDWVEPSCNTRDVIDEMKQLKEQMQKGAENELG